MIIVFTLNLTNRYLHTATKILGKTGWQVFKNWAKCQKYMVDVLLML